MIVRVAELKGCQVIEHQTLNCRLSNIGGCCGAVPVYQHALGCGPAQLPATVQLKLGFSVPPLAFSIGAEKV